MFAGIIRRAKLLAAKTSGQLPWVPWSLLLQEVRQRRELAFATPTPEVLERDEAAGLIRIQYGEERYWLPSDLDLDVLSGIYRETFNPEHPHHFEYGGARIRPGDVVIDAGAFEGLFTRFALNRGARVIAMEPLPQMATALSRTYEDEIQAGQVIVEPLALSDRAEETDLVFDASHPTGANIEDTGPKTRTRVRITSITLPELLRRSPWDRCDFLKMDIEGSELRAVPAAEEVLRQHHPRLSIAVYHRPQGYTEIAQWLRQAGLDYHLAGKGLVHGIDGIWRPLMLHAWRE